MLKLKMQSPSASISAEYALAMGGANIITTGSEM